MASYSICNLKEFRTAMELSPAKLSKLIGIPYSTLTCIENGSSYPRADRRKLIADFFSRTEDEIWPKGVDGKPIASVQPRHHVIKPSYSAPRGPFYTSETLPQAANVHVGDRLRIRIGTAMGDAIYSNCTVEALYPHFFLVRFDHTGAHECFHYQALLGGELRRI